MHFTPFCFTFSKHINWDQITGHSPSHRVILTIFDSKHVIPQVIFNDNCVHLCSIQMMTFFLLLNLGGGGLPGHASGNGMCMDSMESMD